MNFEPRGLFAAFRPSAKRVARRRVGLQPSGSKRSTISILAARFFGRAGGKVYGKIGALEVRLAASRRDIIRAQRLRYQVFYEEMSAKPTVSAQLLRRDEDRFDQLCDHLLVVDTSEVDRKPGLIRRRRQPKVVGTYRILRENMLRPGVSFYTQGEYDIAELLQRHRGRQNFMELGRSCVLPQYRTKRTVELLWHGLWTYIREHKVTVMMGCASFEGTDPSAHASALSFLYHHRLAPPAWRVRALPELHVPMNTLASEAIDPRAALKALPPLIKGYLRLGAFVGDGAVIDQQFGTTDVFIILPVEAIDPRYFEHFGAPDESESRVAVARKT
ncbi:MAG: GNAT family N-acetyltransferase [Hyphomicrobiaceae bacterium]